MLNRYHKDGTIPTDENMIFVFGSNEAGIHGAGAARRAIETFGAEWGVGWGLHGRSFAIPTKDRVINTLPLEKVVENINKFVKFTQVFDSNNVEARWFVTRVGCGLAGFKDSVIAPLFKDAVNCSFAEEWRPYLEN